jgi:hypothetical protein
VIRAPQVVEAYLGADYAGHSGAVA